jgi:hypothetical protein
VLYFKHAQVKTGARLSSWAVPTKADDEAWERMTREEQLAAYQAHFNGSACSTSSETTLAEIVERSRTARKTNRAADG